ncbi:MAG TPA: tRNA (adenosine(37)-N6)-threonylcarbamoyltransferase complex dimerization subunit type 1 TsaB [Terriglobales bacterium]|nr:tRNA (adenosine(37)-N6)-threonylcarbamoyltransferase complex dimerization subunit type 1 TsaB [Terriglobales bacterium]
MLILGIDTSGRNGSVCLAQTGSSFEVLENVPLSGGTYSAQLIPALMSMLQKHGRKKSDLKAYAVASGPGSFTGLRVGLSAVKGLAEILPGPIASVSVLEALAAASHEDGRVITVLDAARKEVYVGEYDVTGGKAAMVRESLMTQTDFAHLLEHNSSAQLITPDADLAELARFHMRVMQVERPQAGEYACLGWLKIQEGQVVGPDLLEANYIRRSDAEIFAKKD